MGLNLNSPEIGALAKELATLTGKPLESAVEDAIREKLAKEKDLAQLLADVDTIQDRYAILPVLDARPDDQIIGYDENGLPA